MELLNQSQIAKRLGLTKGRISQLVTEGRLNHAKVIDPVSGRINFDFSLVEKTLAKETSTLKSQNEEGEEAWESEDISFDQARAKKMHYEAKITELQYRKEVGEFVEAEKVKKIFTEIALWVRDSFTLLPQKLSQLLASKRNPDEIENILDSEFEYILNTLIKKDPFEHILKEDENEDV